MKQRLHGVYDFHETLDTENLNGGVAFNRIGETYSIWVEGTWYCLDYFDEMESGLIDAIRSTTSAGMKKIEIQYQFDKDVHGKAFLQINTWDIVSDKTDPKEYDKVRDYGLF